MIVNIAVSTWVVSYVGNKTTVVPMEEAHVYYVGFINKIINQVTRVKDRHNNMF